MKNNSWHTLFAALFLQTALVAAADGRDMTDLGRLEKIELGSAVGLFLPASGPRSLGWSLGANSKYIDWQNEPYILNPGATRAFRDGVMFITVDGVSSKLLKSRVKDLGWTVSLWTDDPPKFGPVAVTFFPGATDGSNNCFGTSAFNCSFDPIRSLKKGGIQAEQTCILGEGSSERWIVFKLLAPGKGTAAAMLNTSAGSGGSSSSFTIYLHSSPESLCSGP